MKLVVYDLNGNLISVNEFFSKYKEFSENNELQTQTTRFLKVLLRHPDARYYITETHLNDRCFQVSGRCRTYTIVFNYENDCVVLKELY